MPGQLSLCCEISTRAGVCFVFREDRDTGPVVIIKKQGIRTLIEVGLTENKKEERLSPLTTWLLQTGRTTDCATGACLHYHLLLGIKEGIVQPVIAMECVYDYLLKSRNHSGRCTHASVWHQSVSPSDDLFNNVDSILFESVQIFLRLLFSKTNMASSKNGRRSVWRFLMFW